MTWEEIQALARRIVLDGEPLQIELMEACARFVQDRPQAELRTPPTLAELMELHELILNAEGPILTATHNWVSRAERLKHVAEGLPVLIRARKLSRLLMDRLAGEQIQSHVVVGAPPKERS